MRIGTIHILVFMRAFMFYGGKTDNRYAVINYLKTEDYVRTNKNILLLRKWIWFYL